MAFKKPPGSNMPKDKGEDTALFTTQNIEEASGSTKRNVEASPPIRVTCQKQIHLSE